MLIDTERLLRGIQTDVCGHIACHECPMLVSDGYDSTECSLEKYIMSRPEVVMCKDCKWCEKSSVTDMCICTHEVGLIDPKLDDYCSYGERREK